MLYRDVDLLILDEPTAVLIPQEVDDLIRRLIDLKKAGKTIIIITHKLNEVKRCADNITVIRAGHVIGTVPNDENTTDEDLAEMMVGRAVLLREMCIRDNPVGWSMHKLEHELSAFYDVTHGEGLAVIMPAWLTWMLTEDNAYRCLLYTSFIWNIVFFMQFIDR